MLDTSMHISGEKQIRSRFKKCTQGTVLEDILNVSFVWNKIQTKMGFSRSVNPNSKGCGFCPTPGGREGILIPLFRIWAQIMRYISRFQNVDKLKFHLTLTHMICHNSLEMFEFMFCNLGYTTNISITSFFQGAKEEGGRRQGGNLNYV